MYVYVYNYIYIIMYVQFLCSVFIFYKSLFIRTLSVAYSSGLQVCWVCFSHFLIDWVSKSSATSFPNEASTRETLQEQ